MSELPWTPDELRAVTVPAAHDFLTRHGWVMLPSPRSTSRYYQNPEVRDDNGRPLELFFPVSDHYRDYPLGVLSFLSAMSVVHDTTEAAVFRELTGRLPSFQVPAPMPAAS